LATAKFSPDFKKDRGLRVITVAFIAIIFTVVGIIIASNIDLSPDLEAQTEDNFSWTDRYPVVERDGTRESPFVSVVDKVKDAVVNISARSQETNLPWWYHGSGYSTSSGSGFFFRKDGYILTNNHVIKDAEKLSVWTASGYKYDAQLVGADPMTDLAVIKVVPEEEITAIPFGNSDNIKVGDWAIAIGNPFPQQGLDRTVTVGVISAKGRSNLQFGSETPMYQNYIQTDASINPGNSGGPLLNLKGECVGVNAAISSPTGTSVGIGFAIPINLAKAIVPDLIASGKASRGWLGVWLSNVTEREAKRQGLDAVKGVRIDSVFAHSPADMAKIRSGDIITKFNNQQVDNASQLSVLVSTIKNGSDVEIEYVRDGSEHMTRATITDRESALASANERAYDDDFEISRWLGMELMTFTSEIARILMIDHIEGIYVRRVYPNTPADDASITRGTVILQINNMPVNTLEDVAKIARQAEGRKQRIPLIVQEPDGTIARKVIRP